MGHVLGRGQRELEARWLCGRWVREMTNATPEQLGPLELAVEAASFITELAPDKEVIAF